MMNVAPQAAPIPSHFAPPTRLPSTRRPQYHHPNRNSLSPRNSSQQFVTYQHPPSPPPPQSYSPVPPAGFQRSPSYRTTTPQGQQYGHGQPLQPLQRKGTAGSSNSLAQYISPTPPVIGHHQRQTPSTSTSNSSIIRIPSGHAHYPPTAPIIPARVSPASADTYVARLRRAKATVWSARGQREDLDRSISKDDKYNKKYAKRPAPKVFSSHQVVT